MCVAITMLAGTHLQHDEIAKMQRANADGVGVAWSNDGKIYWLKALSPDPIEIVHLLRQTVRYPRLVHFRLATAGGGDISLCHPFGVSPMAESDPMVTITGGMAMIHNGHWHRWSEVKDLLDRENMLPDRGPWSDSRLGALLASKDIEWLDNLGGRTATLDHEGTIERRGDWQELRHGIWVSNKIWDYTNVKRGGYAGYQRWKGWEWDEADWDEIQRERERLEAEAEAAKKEEKDACQLVREEMEDEADKKAGSRKTRATPDSPAGNEGSGHGRKKGKHGGKDYKRTFNSKNERWIKDEKTGTWSRVVYSTEPWFSERTGKWYAWDKSGQVEQVTAPDKKGPSEQDRAGAGGDRKGVEEGEREGEGEGEGEDALSQFESDGGRFTHWSELGGEG